MKEIIKNSTRVTGREGTKKEITTCKEDFGGTLFLQKDFLETQIEKVFPRIKNIYMEGGGQKNTLL